jgi:monoamine oxidase
VVLGGGLAGLCAAYELRHNGFDVHAILEAQHRTGGRVHTWRKGFENGQYAELGATRIPSTHTYTLGYIDAFGLEKRQFSYGDARWYLKGTAFMKGEADPWPPSVLPGLSAEDRSLSEYAIGWKYDRGDEIADPQNPGYLGNPLGKTWPNNNANAMALASTNYHDYFMANGASADAFLIQRAVNGGETLSIGALCWLAGDVLDAAWNETWAIAGGNDLLPAAFTKHLGGIVKYGCKVKGIEQGRHDVTVRFLRKGRLAEIKADQVVCAIPFSVLRDVAITPKLPHDKRTAIKRMHYEPVSRNFIQTDSRFWSSYGVGDYIVARTDSPIERLWENTNVQDGPTGIINAYMQGDSALSYAASGKTFKKRTAYALDHIREFFPEIDEQYARGIEKIWQDDPYARGAYSSLTAGQEWMLPVSKRREKRIHFCGEHTSAWSGWMQGALESANRVVAEMRS